MSLIKQNKKPVKLFMIAILVGITLLYLLCDYYLKSVGRELLINWVRTESAAIQEGNLLTSSTKNQRFILSSDYIKAVKLIKVEQDQVRERLQFGETFEVSSKDLPEMTEEVVVQTSGFLHKKAFYKIPNREEMYMIFDIESKALNTVFFVVSAILLLMVISLVAVIRSIEKKEFAHREEILKQAINDFVSKDTPSDVISQDFPTLMLWWKDKKDQVLTAQDIAIKNQSKIMLGEVASRVGHDIMGSVRNIEFLFKRTTGLDEKQIGIFNDSILKIKTLSSEISKRTKQSVNEQKNLSESNATVQIDQLMKSIIEQKQVQYEGQAVINFNSVLRETHIQNIDATELERSVSNLINNAVEASEIGSVVNVDLLNQDSFVKIQIKDSGSGISTENLKKIGMKGFTANKANGTGIGLFYAKQFVEGLGGKLIVDSVLNQGTTVSLVLPVG